MTRQSRALLALIGGMIILMGLMHGKAAADETDSRAAQLAQLKAQRILVAMWGWPVEQMAPAMVKAGYQVVNSPHGNDLAVHDREAPVWAKAGLKMIVRPFQTTKDPFDPEDVARGCDELNRVIDHYRGNPNVLGFSIAWGLYGEGGFPHDFVFSEKARAAFNAAQGTPGAPLPTRPAEGQPGSLRWVQWLEFRSKTLNDFRQTYIASAKKHTDKLVGTWSEFYPTEIYELNMGDAPGADFLFYDLSFGDVTADQSRALAETHGDMQHYKTYEAWRDHELPLIAKGAGEGVTPMGFQFPMRRGHAADFLSTTTIFIDRIEDEYSLRIGPEIGKLITAARGPVRPPEVALVYQSFAAAALPGGDSGQFYQNSARQIEGLLRQMGVDLRIIPYEHLATADLARYKLVIIPDPLYLSEPMRANLARARRVLYSGEYLLTHHDPATARGDYRTSWSAETRRPNGGRVLYRKEPAGPLTAVAPADPLLRGVTFPAGRDYPADQMALFDPLPAGSRVLLKAGAAPMLIASGDGRELFLTNRFFNNAWRADSDWLEQPAYLFLRNLMRESGVTVRVATPPLCRVREGFPHASYGVTGRIAWNTTPRELTLELTNGQKVIIPPCGWAKVGE